MSEPLNPYAPPSLPDADVVARPWPPPRLDNPFADAFVTGTRLLTRNLLLVTVIVLTVWLPINLWVSYYEMFVIGEDDFARYFRMVMLMEGLFGVVGFGAVTAVGALDIQGEKPTLPLAVKVSLSQWARFVVGGIAMNLLIGLGLLCFIIPGLYFIACSMFLIPVLIVDRVSVGAALQQCFAVGWRRLWLALGLALCVTILEMAVGIALGVATFACSLLELPSEVLFAINALTSVPTDFVGAWGSLVLVAAYIRMRDEIKQEPTESYVPRSTPSGELEQG